MDATPGGATIPTAWIDAVRQARWLGRDRANGYAMILALAYLPLLAIPYLYATGLVGGRHAPVDFMSFWSAGRLAWIDPAAAYDAGREAAFQAQAFGAEGRYLPFLYPPPFLAVCMALAAAPFAIAYPAWVAGTWGLYIAAARRLLPAAAWPIAVFPALYVNAVQGQTAALFAAVFILACLQLERRPILAGLLFGALSFKPQLGLLIPVALVAGGQWRTFTAAALSALGLVAGAGLAFGPQIYWAFLHAGQATAAQLQAGALPWGKFQSLFGALRQLGVAPAPAAALQALAGLAAAALVVWIWRSRAGLPAKAAVLAGATLLATPYLLDYDLALLIAPLAWLAARGAERGFGPWEKAFLALAYISPVLCRGLALWAGVNPQPLIVLAVVAAVVRQSRPASA